jgi:hypothetical protein
MTASEELYMALARVLDRTSESGEECVRLANTDRPVTITSGETE